MDLQNMDLKGGSLQISTEVIGKIARCAALEVDGVSEVSCGKQNKKVKELLAAASIQPPVTVEMRDGTAELTLNLVVKFGAKIPAVAEKVQENVKSAVQNMTNVTVSRVNLVIAGLAADHLRNWTMERLPRVSLTVLRLALAEMLYGDERKPGVVINEAVELTKKYGADEDYQFVNGLLGAVAREQGLDTEPVESEEQ